MDNFYARSVFFVKDGEAAHAFYTQTLGFNFDWGEDRATVFQVSLFGFELILNQVFGDIKDRAGHGRVFLGLGPDQAPSLCQHIRAKGIQTSRVDWGRRTLVIRDPDGNELFFWLPESELASLDSE
jgi:catechol 2,3-dioxygenase-like lactoylglutathione lyase family enzyme